MTKLEQKVRAEIERSERTRDVPLSDHAKRRGTKTVIYSVRLSPERVEQIERVAERLDVPASALVRSWVLAGLAGQDEESVTATIERLETDLRKLRDLVAH